MGPVSTDTPDNIHATATTQFLAPVRSRGGEKLVRARGLSHWFGEGELAKQVLFNIDLDIYAGETVILTGPSGSGKTTLLTLIGGLRTVQHGSLRLFGQELRGMARQELVRIRRQIGFIFQAHNLFASLTARENVRMALELDAMPRAEMDRRADTILRRLGLGHRLDYRPDALSGGQRQRVAIARALVREPRLILADEPTAALDGASGREVVTLFQELTREKGCTVIMVTHDNRVLDIADRLVTLVDGRIATNVITQESSVICDFLRHCPIFQHMTPAMLAEVAEKMFVEEFPENALIIRYGEEGDKFYLVREGSVEVLVQGRDDPQTNVVLGPGSFFGETALLTGAPRNATVRAREPVVLYSLGKPEFQQALEGSLPFKEELLRAIVARR
ncbi:MAG: ABC transporter ATP-binding protein [Pirellulaceae bacterium]|nr:MAG: ABC transporter ATP-binding protein [Pirellulaceae bacterium]